MGLRVILDPIVKPVECRYQIVNPFFYSKNSDLVTIRCYEYIASIYFILLEVEKHFLPLSILFYFLILCRTHAEFLNHMKAIFKNSNFLKMQNKLLINPLKLFFFFFCHVMYFDLMLALIKNYVA